MTEHPNQAVARDQLRRLEAGILDAARDHGVRSPRPRGEGADTLALRKEDAARALGVSDETFDKHVRPTLPTVRMGSVRIYPVEQLQAWLREQSTTPLDEIGRR